MEKNEAAEFEEQDIKYAYPGANTYHFCIRYGQSHKLANTLIEIQEEHKL